MARIRKDTIQHLAVFEAMILSLLLIINLAIAHANGGQLTISMTVYGERWLEMYLLILLTPILALGFHYYLVEEAPRPKQ